MLRRDALGHGHSSGPPKGHHSTFDEVVDELVDTLDQLNIDKVHFLGESTAGIYANFLAARYPDRIRSVTICGSPLVLTDAAQKTLAFGYSSCVESIYGLGARGWGEKFMALSATDQDSDKGFQQWYLEQFALPSEDGLAAYADTVCSKEANSFLILDKIGTTPYLLLTPANSTLVPLDDQKKLAQAAKDSRLELIHGHGHEIFIDQAEECQGKVLDFLGSLQKKYRVWVDNEQH